jgi:hypothetical protein
MTNAPYAARDTFIRLMYFGLPIIVFTFAESACGDLRGSLVADFIQVIAIRDLQNVGYHGLTLMRESQATADKEAIENNPHNHCSG